jgi:APA family basic amino acid/polyamine antiporter
MVIIIIMNIIELRLGAQFQILFVAVLVLALLTFVLPGATAVDPANYTPFFPDLGAFGIAAVALFYPFLGFGLLVELGEEIDDPGRTIPIALFGGVAIVAAFYVALVAVLVGVVPWTELGNPDDLATAAQRFLPPWGASIVAAGALFAVLTSVSTALLTASRTIMRAARDGILPRPLSRVHPRLGTPHYSLPVLGVPPLLLVPLADELIGLSVFIGLASLTAYFFCAIGLWNLPQEFPDHYASAPFSLRRSRGLLAAVLGGALATASFWAVTLLNRPIVGLVLVGWFMVGYGYYRYRLGKADPERMYLTMTSLDEHERAFERRGGPDATEGD